MDNCSSKCSNYSPIEITSDILFTPPLTDKVTSIGGREKIPAYFFVDPDEPNILYVKTCDKAEIVDNSTYKLTIPSIEFKDGDVKEKYTVDFVTAPSPAYVSINDVISLCHGIPVEPSHVAYYIKESSKIADYWAFREKDESNNNDLKSIFNAETFEEDYYPFYMFVKYRSVVEVIKEFYMTVIANPSEYHDILSDLERSEKMDLDAIKKLLDSLDEEANDWLELVTTITADPEWALRGKYSFAITNYNYRPYHPTGLNRTNWDRGY